MFYLTNSDETAIWVEMRESARKRIKQETELNPEIRNASVDSHYNDRKSNDRMDVSFLFF